MGLNQRLKFLQLFDPKKTLPTNEAEAKDWFKMLLGELSPENLHCDGLASGAQVKAKLKDIKDTWKELEVICGRKVSQEEAESFCFEGS